MFPVKTRSGGKIMGKETLEGSLSEYIETYHTGYIVTSIKLAE